VSAANDEAVGHQAQNGGAAVYQKQPADGRAGLDCGGGPGVSAQLNRFTSGTGVGRYKSRPALDEASTSLRHWTSLAIVAIARIGRLCQRGQEKVFQFGRAIRVNWRGAGAAQRCEPSITLLGLGYANGRRPVSILKITTPGRTCRNGCQSSRRAPALAAI